MKMTGRGFAIVALALGSAALVGCAGSPSNSMPAGAVPSEPSPAPVPAVIPADAVTVNLLANQIEFRPAMLQVPAGVPFVIHFRNADMRIEHDVDIRQLDGITVLRDQVPIGGGTEVNYVYAALPRGDYQLICEIHPIPSMTRTLRVR